MKLRMKRTLIFLLFTGGLSLFGNPINVETAQKVAENFMKMQNPRKSCIVNQILVEKYKSSVVFYIVNFKNNGWVMVSADDNIIPILGFSFTGNIYMDAQKPEAYKNWINNYKTQIFYATQLKNASQKNLIKWKQLIKLEQFKKNRIDYVPGTALLNTVDRGEVLWNQDINNSGGCVPSYNKYCPGTNDDDCDCNHKPAGCGAVALGQIMWYWQWPNKSNYRSYDWNLMPNELLNTSTIEQGDEIAHLLSDIGESSNMTYWCAGSWTTVNNLEEALKNNFNYKSVEKKIKNNWSYNDVWNDLIRAEIDAERPVVYRGDKSDLSGEKHIFVIDGYSVEDDIFFHINWGWAGYCNGYYYFNDLTPGDNNFNNNQMAIIGISPTCDVLEYNIYDVLYSSVTGFEHEQAGNNIALPAHNKNLTIENNGKLIFTAGNNITLNQNFIVEKGGKFKTNIRKICGDQSDMNISQWTNVFTPNNDGINDELCFDVYNANTWEFQAYSVSSNQLVFQSAGTISDNSVCVWDGTGACDQCTYLCSVKFRNTFGKVLENTYYVYVIMNNSRNISSIVLKNNTNNKNDKLLNKSKTLSEAAIKIFPNPNNGKFHLTLNNIKLPCDIKCFNSFGNLIYEKSNLNSNKYDIILNNAIPGVYNLQLVATDKMFNYKFIVNY